LKLIETLFLGFLIACASFIAQVFFEVIAEIFFHTDIVIHYSATDSTKHIIFIMFIAAIIEELIRYSFIKYKTVKHINKPIIDPIIYGVLLGIGFITLEIIFSYFSNTLFITPVISIIIVAMIHILLSIFLLFITKYTHTFIVDIPFVIIAILLHVCGNFFLLQYM
jgi:hypothetical protein